MADTNSNPLSSARIHLVQTMVTFSISSIYAGWVHARIGDGETELSVTASYTPSDCIRDFVDCVASLRTGTSTSVCWYQEPGEIHWHFERSGDDLHIVLTEFDRVTRPGRHAINGAVLFSGDTKWLRFGAQVLRAMTHVHSTLGEDGYEVEWKYAFPKEACVKLEVALQSDK